MRIMHGVIPDLAAIIGAYVIFRAFETFLLSPSRYRAPIVQLFVFMAAGMLIVLTLFLMLDIFITGSSSSSLPSVLR